ncbi:MAG: CopG family transcriptional regulator [Flavobacteriales bacterium]|nr:CopG family transcriptional regulator [Flavobacteriales bacterium]
MNRQSISFTEPNDKWMKAQIESKEYSSKSELVNDLIRQARRAEKENELIRKKLETAEQGGFTNSSPEQILAESEER